MTTPETAAEIAAGLSEAQRRALINARTDLHLKGVPTSMLGASSTCASLTRKGLLKQRRWLDWTENKATPLGLAVRHILKGEEG